MIAAIIIGAETPAEIGETKTVVKSEGQSNNQHNGRSNMNYCDNYIKKETFLGADPNLCWDVFEAKCNQFKQVSNFTIVYDIVKAQVGTECDPFILESSEKGVKTVPNETEPVTVDDSSMSKTEQMKFKRKYDIYLNWVHNV